MPGPAGRQSALAAGFTVLFVGTGVNFAFGILFKPILLELGGRRSTLALAATAGLLVNALGQPLYGALVDRLGPRRVILPCLALMAVGTGLVALAQAPWQLILLYGVVAAIGYTGAGILSVSIHVTRWFPGERGFAVAVAACGFSLGHLAFTQLAAHLAEAVGWRRTYLVLGVLVAVFVAILLGWLRDAPRAPAAPPASPAPQAPPTARLATAPANAPGIPSLDRRAALRTGGFWGMTLGLMGCGFTDFLLTTHLAPFTSDLGLSPTVAANAVSLWAAANIGGILLGGTIAARVGPRQALVGTYLLRAASLAALPLVGTAWQLYAFAVAFGATFFTTAPLSSTLVGMLFGPAHQGAIFGAANLFHHSAGALGSYAGGLAYDLTGSYRPIFVLSAVLVLGSAVSTALAAAPRRVPVAPEEGGARRP